MPRPEEVEVVKAMKAAKTGEEILASWAMQRPGYKPGAKGDPTPGLLGPQQGPEMLHTFAQNQLSQLLDRGILDPKTRYLLLVGLYMMNNHWDGVLPAGLQRQGRRRDRRRDHGSGLLRVLLGGQGQDAGKRPVPGHGLLEPHLPGDHPAEEVASRADHPVGDRSVRARPPSCGLALFAPEG